MRRGRARSAALLVSALVAVSALGTYADPVALQPAGTLADVNSGRLRITDAGLEVAIKEDKEEEAATATTTTTTLQERWRQQRRAAAQAAEASAPPRPARGPPANSVWRPATPEQQLESLKGVVPVPAAEAGAGAGAAAAKAAPAAPAASLTQLSPADALAAAVAVGSDATLAFDDEMLLEPEQDDSFAVAGTTETAATAPSPDEQQQRRLAWSSVDTPRTSRSQPRVRGRTPPELGVRSANLPRSPRLLTSSAAAKAAAAKAETATKEAKTPTPTHGRALQQLGGGGALPPTTTASHATPVKVGACGLAEVTGGSALASPAASGTGLFGWAIAVNKGADVMVIGQPGVEVDTADYANVVLTYAEGDEGAAFVFAAVPGGGSAVPLHFAKSCSFADQRLVNPIWRVDKEVVGFGTEVAVSFKGNTALVAGRLIPNPPNGDDDDGVNPLNWAPYGTDMVWAFQKGVTGYLQFSRQEMPLINPPVGDQQFVDEDVLRRIMALGLSFDGGLAMAAYVTLDKDNNLGSMSEVGGSLQVFGSTKERFLLTQVIEPPQGSRVQSWSVAAAMSADSQTIIASDGSGGGTLLSDGELLDQVAADEGVYLEDGSGVFVFARTDGLSVTKPDGKVGLVQSNATARYTLAGLLRPPLWTEDIAPGEYNATATFGTALAITAKGKFIAVVERRYVANTTQTDDDDAGGVSPFAIAHSVHVYQRVEGTGKGLTAMYGLKCTLDDPDPLRYASFGYGRHQVAIAQDGKFVTVAVGSQPSTLAGAQADLPNSVYVYRIVAGQTAGKGEDICPFQPEFVVDDPLFIGADQTTTNTDDQPSFFGESVALSADGKVLVVGQPETMVDNEPGSVYLYDLRKPVKKDVYVGNAPLVGVGGYKRRR